MRGASVKPVCATTVIPSGTERRLATRTHLHSQDLWYLRPGLDTIQAGLLPGCELGAREWLRMHAGADKPLIITTDWALP